MATFNFNVIEESGFNVELHSVVETDCASRYVYKIKGQTGDVIKFSLSEGFENSSYTVLGIDVSFISETTITYQNDLYINFTILNSGTPGVFKSVTTFVENITGGFKYEDTVTREDDSIECGKVAGGISYDELTDTPENKTGKSLQVVRVKEDESGLEYTDIGSLGNDLNYSEQFSSSSSWSVSHNLGKIPSVTVLDSLGNRVHGDISYDDMNNLTITFNTAFAGTVYLN